MIPIWPWKSLAMSMFATFATVIALNSAAIGQSPQGVNAGMLNCNLSPSVGLIFGSHQTMACRFTPAGPYPPQIYTGVINTVGLDIGFSAGGALAWAVFAPTAGELVDGLAGHYAGVSGEVGVGVGAGANILIGGSNRTISLQPLSVEGEVGVNLAVGLSGMELRPAQ